MQRQALCSIKYGTRRANVTVCPDDPLQLTDKRRWYRRRKRLSGCTVGQNVDAIGSNTWRVKLGAHIHVADSHLFLRRLAI